MTLYRQLLTAVIVLFLLLYAVTVFSIIRSNAELVERQMHAHAQDTANSLALSMSQAALAAELAVLETMFNAVADRGYFQRLEFVDLTGDVVIEREFPVLYERVPQWFVELIPLAPVQASAEVSMGWTRSGVVTVYSYPGQAYRTLWTLTVEQLSWFVAVAVLVLLLSILALRVMLRPLQRVEQQADRICKQQFPVQAVLPRTRELARVVEAMNRMSRRLKELFDGQVAQIQRLQETSFRDPVTGLSNRADFDAGLQALIEEDERASGALMILSIADFARVNARAGRLEGNAVLHALATRLKPLGDRYPGLLLARRQGADFTLFVPGISEEGARDLAAELLALTAALSWTHQATDPLQVHIGYTHQEQVSDPAALLREADAALRQARHQPLAGAQAFADSTPIVRPSRTAEDWRDLFARCLTEQQTVLALQPMLKADRSLVGHEVYVRLREDEDYLSPSVFLAAAERLGYVSAIDRAMLEALPSAANQQGWVVVNLSGLSAADAGFQAWLPTFLNRHPALAQRLVIEFPEYHLAPYGDAIAGLAALIAPSGVKLAVDHFGRGSLAVKHLYSLPLLYLKLHRSLVRDIGQNADQQAYVHALVQMARAREIQLFAEGVESAEEFEMLASLGIGVMQGYHLGRPGVEPMDTGRCEASAARV